MVSDLLYQITVTPIRHEKEAEKSFTHAWTIPSAMP
jgi:hypothetical protein